MGRPLVALLALAVLAVLAPAPPPAPTAGPPPTRPAAPFPTPAPAAAETPPDPLESWRPDTEAARAYARKRAGIVAFAVRTRDRAWGFRSDRATRSASVVKAMLMLAYLRKADVRARPLTAADRALLAPMIRWSDNEAANRVSALVGTTGLLALASRARMRRFATTPIWGMSRITAADQTRLFLDLERLTPRRHRAYALRLLATIVPGQRWGLARARPAGWRLHFKGGWGSGTGEVNHQVALLRHGDARVAVAILTEGNPSHAYGSETLRGVAVRLLRGLAGAARGDVSSARSAAPAPSCRRSACATGRRASRG